ncbi:MAG: phage Gp37/Gp68 family protein [Acidobacteria bacterium]|nr:phage Gp37/Gp68 family protein [Acidobacteriota bacterium]
MAEDTKIEWADHTFNPWIGCTKVSPACDHCYAEAQTKRFDPDTDLWSGGRRRTAEANWKQPLKWNRQAPAFFAAHGRMPMVFCASLADVFDNQVPPHWRDALWALIDATPELIWLLLTKRPHNIRKMLPPFNCWENHPWEWDTRPWPNVWLGTTVENQAEADRRIPHLLAVPAAKRFLSCEPLLGPVDLTRIPVAAQINAGDQFRDAEVNCLSSGMIVQRPGIDALVRSPSKIDWVIAGGESGPQARPSHPDWFRGLRDQCASAGVPFLFKQWGDWVCEIQAPEDAVFPGEGRNFFGMPDYWGKLGKKKAGRLLDGVLHDGRPEVAP